MAPKGILITIIVLRFVTLILLAGSIALMATNKFATNDGTKTSFKDVHAYRYVIATAVFGFVYSIVQLPFAIYYAVKEERLIRNECLPSFDFYGDKIIACLLATGVGAGFGVTFEFKRLLDSFLDSFAGLGDIEEEKSDTEKFLDKANLSTGLLFLGFLCMLVLSVFSSIFRTSTNSNSSRSGFFFR